LYKPFPVISFQIIVAGSKPVALTVAGHPAEAY